MKRRHSFTSGASLLFLLTVFVVMLLLNSSRAKNPNEHVIKPAPNVQDPDDIFDKNGKIKAEGKIWALEFKFKPLRSIKVNIPGRGERICWYLWYQVANKTKKPHFFIPNFELVTQDTRKVYRDEILPKVQAAIIEREDPAGVLDMKNSITIFKEPIPPSKENALPTWVSGVAIWTDPAEPLPTDDEATKKKKEKEPKLSDTNFFSIFVAGLSNGWAETDPLPGSKDPVIRRKTLQINFRRFGDGALRRDNDIRYISHKWIYRASHLKVPKD